MDLMKVLIVVARQVEPDGASAFLLQDAENFFGLLTVWWHGGMNLAKPISRKVYIKEIRIIPFPRAAVTSIGFISGLPAPGDYIGIRNGKKKGPQ